MISPLFAILYGSIIEYKISFWLDDNNLRAKVLPNFRNKHSTIDHVFIFWVIVKNCGNDKEDLFACFVDFKKVFDIVPKNKLLKCIANLDLLLDLRLVVYKLYEQVITKLKTNQG